MMDNGVIRIPGHIERLHIRTMRFDAIRKLPAAHPGHHRIGQHQVNSRRISHADLKGLFPGPDSKHRVAIAFKGLRDVLY